MKSWIAVLFFACLYFTLLLSEDAIALDGFLSLFFCSVIAIWATEFWGE